LDVVDDEKSGFTPFISKDRIYGRGSGDMKAGCAAMMKFLKDLSQKKNKLSVGLLLTTDEELGGVDGVGYLLSGPLKNLKPKGVIIPDGGEDLKKIVLGQKGVLQVKIWSEGKSAHGAKPFLGENAIEKLMGIYKALKREFPSIQKGQWKNTMNLGKIVGGESINKVPDKAEMFLDFRFTEKGDDLMIERNISRLTKDFEIIAGGDCLIQDRNDIFLKEYKKIAEKRIGEKIEFMKTEGASDARYFSAKNIPVVITKIKCDNIHSKNEWVEMREMEEFYEILRDFFQEDN